jgi:hypothetical protein
MSTVRDGDNDLDLVTPQMHCHRCIDRGTSGIHGGTRAEPLTSALTLIDDSGLTMAVDAPPLRWGTWLWYSSNRATIVPAYQQEVLGAPVLQRGTCCKIHPIICGLPSGRQTTGASVGTMDTAVLHGPRGAQELPLSLHLPRSHRI